MKTLLLIEDHPDMRENTMEILELAGYKVITAENGRAGIDAALKTIPDLIICDVMMPEMDGFELLSNIRRDPALENLPVIMLTAKAQDRDVLEGYTRGADMYLTKPFNPIELVTFAKRLLQSGADDGRTVI